MRWYGPGYEGGALVLALAAVVAILTSVNTALASLIISSGSMWVAFALNALWAAALLISSLILIPRYLATGLSIAYVLAYVAHTVSQSLYGLRRLRVGGTGE
jgi:O-antigen/teichoic acid export membrane protein